MKFDSWVSNKVWIGVSHIASVAHFKHDNGAGSGGTNNSDGWEG